MDPWQEPMLRSHVAELWILSRMFWQGNVAKIFLAVDEI
jgi:hypothetical protein